MCGICGYMSLENVPDSILVKMSDSMRHRGPDSSGVYRERNVALAMRRLSIIDLETGDQPIYNADKSRVIVFNGEIYNYQELRTQLARNGYPFQTQSDTEAILAGYEQSGPNIFSKLNGMFGIAICDQKERRLVLARDRIGIKPLFYYQDTQNFIFGSEIKAILAHPAYHKQINYSALDNVIAYKYIPGDDSIFEGIKKLRPGYYMVIDFEGHIRAYTQYWSLKRVLSAAHFDSYTNAKHQLRHTVFEAVKRRMISDVPLGAFLSGGIDSGIVVGIMAQLSCQAVKTFSIGFEAKSFNELRWAKLSAQKHHTDHYDYIIHPENVLELIDELVGYIDEPLGDYSILPTYYVSKFTRNYVTVALSGSGADELFAGYERYWVNKFDRLLNMLPRHVKTLLRTVLNRLPTSARKKGLIWRSRKFFNEIDKPLPERYEGVLSLLDSSARSLLYHEDLRAKLLDTHHAEISSLFDEVPHVDFLKQCSYVDLKTMLVDDYLVKEDRMSMANSLEVRVPFLDAELVELAMKIRSQWKLKGFRTKYILKDTFSDLLPQKILSRGKYGFDVPFGIWVQHELKNPVRDTLLHSYLVKDHILNQKRLALLLDEHIAGKNNHSKLLFTLLTVEFWLRRYFD